MKQRKINIIIGCLVFLLLFVMMFDRIFYINGPGESAVIYKPFSNGVDKKAIYREGIYLTFPWNTVYKFNIREQMVNEISHIIVKNGVTVSVQFNYRYYPIHDSIGVILQRYGQNYLDIFVKPEIIYAVRERISGLTPEELYTLKLDSLKISAYESSLSNLREGNVIVSDVLILDLKLPPTVVAAIEEKLQEEQRSKLYDFKIQIAEKEKRIKIIDAQAIKIAQDSINKGMTPGFLRYKQIDAMLNLSTSPNAKTIVVPQGADNPYILDAK